MKTRFAEVIGINTTRLNPKKRADARFRLIRANLIAEPSEENRRTFLFVELGTDLQQIQTDRPYRILGKMRDVIKRAKELFPSEEVRADVLIELANMIITYGRIEGIVVVKDAFDHFGEDPKIRNILMQAVANIGSVQHAMCLLTMMAYGDAYENLGSIELFLSREKITEALRTKPNHYARDALRSKLAEMQSNAGEDESIITELINKLK